MVRRQQRQRALAAARAQEVPPRCARSSAPGWRCPAPLRRRCAALCPSRAGRRRGSRWRCAMQQVVEPQKHGGALGEPAVVPTRPAPRAGRGARRATSAGVAAGTSPSVSPVKGASTAMVSPGSATAARAARRASSAALTLGVHWRSCKGISVTLAAMTPSLPGQRSRRKAGFQPRERLQPTPPSGPSVIDAGTCRPERLHDAGAGAADGLRRAPGGGLRTVSRPPCPASPTAPPRARAPWPGRPPTRG